MATTVARRPALTPTPEHRRGASSEIVKNILRFQTKRNFQSAAVPQPAKMNNILPSPARGILATQLMGEKEVARQQSSQPPKPFKNHQPCKADLAKLPTSNDKLLVDYRLKQEK